MAKVLVTGGAGYIGSHCVKGLLEQGHDVLVVDNLTTGFDFLVNNVSRALGRPIPFHRLDVGNGRELRQLMEREKIEGVFHFAASSLVGESQRIPMKYYSNNTAQTLVLVEAMTLAGVKNLVFSSTAAVYGEAQKTPIDESHPIAPINHYGRSKRLVEEVLLAAASTHGLNTTILRYFNVAGADKSAIIGECHDPETHLVPLVLRAALGISEKCSIMGTDYPTPDGTAVRDYIHVSDLVRAHLMAFDWMRRTGNSGVFNLGSENGYSVREVVDTVKRVTGLSFKTEETLRRAGDPPVLLATSAAIAATMGWKAELSLDEMVASAYAWMCKTKESRHVLPSV